MRVDNHSPACKMGPTRVVVGWPQASGSASLADLDVTPSWEEARVPQDACLWAWLVPPLLAARVKRGSLSTGVNCLLPPCLADGSVCLVSYPGCQG